VLDRLLEDEELEIAGITGTSAGALNGAALKAGLLRGGRGAARQNLDWLWDRVGAAGDFRLTNWMSHFAPSPGLVSQAIGHSLPYAMLDTAQQVISPYYYGPFYRHPLRPVVDEFDFGMVCAAEGPAFFVCATNVRSGKARVFAGDEITTDAILASACLPTLFQAVEIEDPATGETDAYWDGGYTGNPALYPLFDPALPDDIVIVNINPLERPAVPRTPQEIQNRIDELSFNSALLHDLRAVSFVKRLIAEGRIERGAMKDVLVHMIADDDLMRRLNVATKLVPNPVVLGELKQAGRSAAELFLADHRDKLNVTGSIDLEAMFS